MRKLLFIFVSILFFCGGLVAQTNCPEISTSGPSGIVYPGDPVIFTATVEPSGKDLKYEWSISAGEIIEGQGTTVIRVGIPKKGDVINVTATIQIAGLPAGCPNTMSETASTTICYVPEILDEFRGPITVKHKIRVENAEIRLRNDHEFKLVIVLYYKSARQREIDKRAILKYLNPLVRGRVVFVNGPDRGDGPRVKLWLVPAGAEDPAI